MTSYLDSPAPKPYKIDNFDISSPDIFAEPVFNTETIHSLTTIPLKLAAKLTVSHSSANIMEKDNFKYDELYEQSPEDMLHQHLHPSFARQDMFGSHNDPQFDLAMTSSYLAPEMDPPLDHSFMASSFTDSPVETDHVSGIFDVAHIGNNVEYHGDNFYGFDLHQPVPRRAASDTFAPPPYNNPIYHAQAGSPPTSSASSILTPVSSVGDEQRSQITNFRFNGVQLDYAPQRPLKATKPPQSFSRPGNKSNKCGVATTRTPRTPIKLNKNKPFSSAEKIIIETNIANRLEPSQQPLRPDSAKATSSPGVSSTSASGTSKSSSMLPLDSALTTRSSPQVKRAKRDPKPAKSTVDKAVPTLDVQDPQPVKKKHRRRHTQRRSRSGCWICRIKHLKCDETKPSCKHCSRCGITCDYNPERPDYVLDKTLRRKKLDELSTKRRRKSS
ncbi:hypothetical protein FDK38_002383 [Candidozyma auris]|nr:hypothetical protein FDK38_002383 [[Candida] auris]